MGAALNPPSWLIVARFARRRALGARELMWGENGALEQPEGGAHSQRGLKTGSLAQLDFTDRLL